MRGNLHGRSEEGAMQEDSHPCKLGQHEGDEHSCKLGHVREKAGLGVHACLSTQLWHDAWETSSDVGTPHAGLDY